MTPKNTAKRPAGLPARSWFSFILLGLVGQFAWMIENMYFNVFLYKTISTDPVWIAAMVASSAIAATATTLIMGGISDRLGKRKVFIAWGYVAWGLSTLAFAFISVKNVAAWFPAANAVHTAATLVIVMDCVMTFFGSTANDAAFNAYVTDLTTPSNRGRVEAVLAVLPLLAMLVIFGAFDGFTQSGRWADFFIIFGSLVSVTGLAALIFLKDAPLEKNTSPFLLNLAYGFRPAVVAAQRQLYTAFVAMLVFSIAVQVFMPYLIIYLQYYLKIDAYALVLGVVLLAASAVSVLAGRFIDKVGKLRFVLPATGLMLAGLGAMAWARTLATVMVAGIILMSGYMLVHAALQATIRDYTPADKAGHFQGIRMIFAVMLPMIIGPFIGSAVIKSGYGTYQELGAVKNIPGPAIFAASAAVLALAFIPILALKKNAQKL